MVDVFVHRTGLDTAAVEERCDLVQVVPDGGKLPCDSFDLVRVDINRNLPHDGKRKKAVVQQTHFYAPMKRRLNFQSRRFSLDIQ